jgi:colanic acid biosynthesis glycosyl transferase WcaI
MSALVALPLVREVDVIWAANPNVFSAFLALFIGKLTRTPVVGNVDDVWPEELFDLGMINSKLLRKIAERVSEFAYTRPVALTPISQAYLDTLKSKYPGLRDNGRCRVIPAGVDMDEFPPTPGPTDLGLRVDGFKVLYIGVFSPAYDFEQVFGAARLLAGHSDIHFVLQGGGELATQLQSRAEQLSLANVHVIERIVPRREVASILSGADALLLPLASMTSIEMGISSKLYEYQASGKPIICCSAGESASYVSGSQSGIVVPPGDSEALAQAILHLRSDRRMGASLGEAGRAHAKAHFSCESVGRLMETTFVDALSHGSAEARITPLAPRRDVAAKLELRH